MENIGFIYAIGAAVVWGLVYTLDQKILSDISPVTLLFIHSFISTIIVLPLISLDNDSMKSLFSGGRTNLLLVITTAVLATLANFLILSGIKTLNASTASIIEIAYPFFVTIFSFIILRATPNIYFLFGGLLVFIGSVIIIRFA